MSQALVAPLLDIKAFAKATSTLSGRDALEKFERLREESQGLRTDQWVEWSARGEWIEDLSGQGVAWLYLSANVSLSQICQRCLGPAEIPVALERSFRFVATEEMAEEQDDEAEEDVTLTKSVFTGAQDRILFTTFTRNLAEAIDANLEELDASAFHKIRIRLPPAWRFRTAHSRPVKWISSAP